MSDLGDLLKKLRGKKSLREAAKKAGISHTYLSIVESGVDLRSGSPVNPTPETLKSLAKAYNYSYESLMSVAGYIEEDKKESAGTLPESEIERIISELEQEENISIRDNPLAHQAVRNALDLVVQIIKSSK